MVVYIRQLASSEPRLINRDYDTAAPSRQRVMQGDHDAARETDVGVPAIVPAAMRMAMMMPLALSTSRGVIYSPCLQLRSSLDANARTLSGTRVV